MLSIFRCGCMHSGDNHGSPGQPGQEGMTAVPGRPMGTDGAQSTVSDKLRLAASKGQYDVVRDLFRTAGVTFNRDRDGRTALHYAALNGFADVTKFLLEKGCPMNIQDASGYTALHRAASGGHLEVITALVEAGCDVNIQDEHGNGALHEAAWHGYSKTLELLVKHDVNIAIVNKAGFTALHLSSQNGHNESSRILLYAGCNSDHKNNYGDTALHTAARYGHAGVTRILISARAKLNEHNKNGDTTLHIAAALKRRKIAKLLVESGIDVNIRNKQNETAGDVAKRKEHDEITLIIQSFSKTKAPKPRVKEVNFREELNTEIDGPVVVPDRELPGKPDTRQENKNKKFFFFKKKKTKEKDKPPPDGGVTQQKQVPQDKGGPTGKTPVQGFFSQYVPRHGVQYYRDLAGNVKQGPIGYSPICNCMPNVLRLEQRLDTTKHSVYGQLETNKQEMQEQLDQYDHRASLRIHALEQYTRDRFIEEEKECQHRIQQRLQERDQVYVPHSDNAGMHVQDWLEAKLSGYGHCLNHHHDDTALPSDNLFTNIHETENGRLFKSRSDETLSQSDNHSGRFRKRDFYESRQAAMQQIRAWQVPNYSRDRNRVRVQAQPAGNTQPVPASYRSQAQPNIKQSQSRQTVMSQAAGRQFPVEARVEVRKPPLPMDLQSPSTVSTHNSPYNSPSDPTYVSMTGGYQNQGAIPKRLPQPQTWQNSQPYNRPVGTARGSGPVTHSTPKSRESSPFENQYHSIPKSHTDSGLSKKVSDQRPSVPSRATLPRASVPATSAANVNNSSERPLSSAKQFPQNHSMSSIGNASDKFQTSHSRPTFTTFGYEEAMRDGRTAPANSPEQVKINGNNYVNHSSDNTQNAPAIASGSNASGTPRSNSGTNNSSASGRDEVDTQIPFQSGRTHVRQDSYGFAPTNKDDSYAVRGSPNPVLRQRAHSTEGLLEEESPRRNLFGRSKSEERTLDSPNRPQSPAASRSTSETRGINSSSSSGNRPLPPSPYTTPQKSSLPQTTSVYSTPVYRQTNTATPDSPMGVSASNTRAGNSVNSQGDNSQSAGPGYFHYTPVKEIPVGNVIQYRGPARSEQRRTVGDNSYSNGARESPYSSVRDVRLLKDSNQNIIVKADVHDSSSQRVYYSNQEVLSGAKTQSILEPRSHTAYQTYLTEGSSRENLYRENSPNICNNSKEDSSSNPDSGYSSKIYGNKGGSNNPPSSSGTPSSSFSTDRGISTPSHTHSPYSQYSNGDYETIPPQHYQEEVQSQVQNWYKRKLQEATQRYHDDWKGNDVSVSPTKVSQNGQTARYAAGQYESNGYSQQIYSSSQHSGNQHGNPNQYGGQSQYESYSNHGNYSSAGRAGNYSVSGVMRGSDV